jgi:hypothetical protein
MIRAVIAGLGNMGLSHALALHKTPVWKSLASSTAPRRLPEELQPYPA